MGNSGASDAISALNQLGLNHETVSPLMQEMVSKVQQGDFRSNQQRDILRAA